MHWLVPSCDGQVHTVIGNGFNGLNVLFNGFLSFAAASKPRQSGPNNRRNFRRASFELQPATEQRHEVTQGHQQLHQMHQR